MAAIPAEQTAIEETSENESVDDSEDQDGSDDSSSAEDWERSSSADMADEDDKLPNEQKPTTRAKARSRPSNVVETRRVQNCKTDVAPALREAVDAVVKKGMSINAAAKQHSTGYKSLRLAAVNTGYQPRRRAPSKAHTDAAVKDIVDGGMSIKKAAKLHHVHHQTLNRALKERNLVRGKPSKPHVQKAVDAVMKEGMSMIAAAKLYKISVSCTLRPFLMKAGLQPPSCSRSKARDKGQHEAAVKDLVKKSICAGANRSLSQPPSKRRSTQEGTGNGSRAVEQERQEIANMLPKDAGRRGDEGANTTDQLPDQEIGRIEDVRTHRQYLVKWQGDEEATWVDEDIFLGLTNLAIK